MSRMSKEPAADREASIAIKMMIFGALAFVALAVAGALS